MPFVSDTAMRVPMSKMWAMQTEWQVRVCYYHYQKMRRQFPGGAMGGFTRLLHR